ncbi:MAG: hypothetical protein R2685_01085 [Candidatus Nitrosocosmicus sp.]|nr:hypothetical protein [Candidatus Nitrosocosmicus sp.]
MIKLEKEANISSRNTIYLKVFIVEPILIACIDKASLADIHAYVQRVLPNTTESQTKEYLFYLINGSFIDYNGKNKLYSTSQDGLNFLGMIYSQKNVLEVEDYSTLTVKVE